MTGFLLLDQLNFDTQVGWLGRCSWVLNWQPRLLLQPVPIFANALRKDGNRDVPEKRRLRLSETLLEPLQHLYVVHHVTSSWRKTECKTRNASRASRSQNETPGW